jgi:hypothetical protein
MRNKYGNQWKSYPVCSTNGPYVKLNEAHVLLGCPATASERKDCEIAEYVEQYQGMATNYILRW